MSARLHEFAKLFPATTMSPVDNTPLCNLLVSSPNHSNIHFAALSLCTHHTSLRMTTPTLTHVSHHTHFLFSTPLKGNALKLLQSWEEVLWKASESTKRRHIFRSRGYIASACVSIFIPCVCVCVCVCVCMCVCVCTCVCVCVCVYTDEVQGLWRSQKGCGPTHTMSPSPYIITYQVPPLLQSTQQL